MTLTGVEAVPAAGEGALEITTKGVLADLGRVGIVVVEDLKE